MHRDFGPAGLSAAVWTRARQWGVQALLGMLNGASWLFERCTRARGKATGFSEILILRTAAVGDFLLSIPAMQRVRAAYPSAKITLLTAASTHRATLKTVQAYSKGASPWLALLPRGTIDEIVTFSIGSYASLLGSPRTVIRGGVYDACFIVNEGIALSLSGTAKKIAFLRLLGVRCRIFGIRTRAYPRLFASVQRGDRRLEHHVTALMRSVEEDAHVALTPESFPYFNLARSGEADAWAEAKLAEFGSQSADLIVVAPGSRLEFKRWAVGNFTKLIVRILASPRTQVVLVGTVSETMVVRSVKCDCEKILGDTKRLHDLGGQTSLAQLAALLRYAAVLVANDGGVCHLAAAVGCRVVSIANGAEYPNAVDPWGSQRFTARFDVPCAACYALTHCPRGDSRCVSGVDPGVVFELLSKAIAESRCGRKE